MAMPSRTLTNLSHTPDPTLLVTSITSLLQTLNPQNTNPTNLISTPLNRFSPNLDSNLVIKVIKNQTNPYHALFFFNWASNPNPNPKNYTHTHFCYVAITDLLLSHSLFSTASSLLQKSQRLSDFFIGKLIKAYGDRSDIRAAIFWLHRAKLIENGRCLFSYNAVLGVLVRANRIGLAKAFFDQMVKDGVLQPDVSTYTIMIRGFCKLGMIENARKVFDEMVCEPNLVTYNTMINGFCKKGDMESARIVFYQMIVSNNCLPDTVTYTTLIDGYCKKGEMEEAMRCMDEMVKRGCYPNLLTYNAIIYGLCLRGLVEEAKRVMTKMRLNGVKDDVATHTSILKGLCIVGKSEEAVKYLKKMVGQGLKPDVKMYGVVVNEYCKMRKPDEAISLLNEMWAGGINPSVSSFNAVFRILVDLGGHDRAILLLKQMPQMGCSPNFLSYSSVICSLCRTRGRMQEVEELVGDMVRNGQLIDATMSSCLIVGYCEDRNEEMAMRVCCEAIDKYYVINLESFSVLVKELSAKRKMIEAKKIFEEMCRRCPVVDLDSYKTVFDKHLYMYSGDGF